MNMRKLPSLVNLFAILWFLLTPVAIHFDDNVVSALGLAEVLSYDLATKYYYMALYVVTSVVLLLTALANMDRRRE